MRFLFDNTPDEILARREGSRQILIASCGLGLNSVAGLILLRDSGDIPDAILFADTGGESNRTYAYLPILNAWLAKNHMPRVAVVKRDCDHDRQKNETKYDTLEQECLVKKCLPSIAYYGRSCSQKWKHAPQEKWANSDYECLLSWATGKLVVKAIFYDAGEAHRVKHHRDAKYAYWHPLYDAGWDRDDCIRAVEREGLPVPPKSSCFFCPEMTPNEIVALGREEPELLERALKLEANANLTSIKGLGKHAFSWRDLVAGRVPLEVIERENKGQRWTCMCSENNGACS